MFRFESITSTDVRSGPLLALNNAAVPNVNDLDAPAFARLIDASAHALAVIDDYETPIGLIVLFAPGSGYESENYRWFEKRAAETGRDFLYVDRVVIAETARSMGIGAALYAHVFELAAGAGRAEVTCEVNLDPPNPRSLAFHARQGFTEVGRQVTKGGAYTVALLAVTVG